MQADTLVSIIAHARAGALNYAWALFMAGGYGGQADDPAVLSVRGRLLKDRALQASGDEARALFLEAAAAYAAAAALDPQPYPLINVATLTFLSGDRLRAADLARDVLHQLDGPAEFAETPYYIAATRSEALLLLGEHAEADHWLGKAIEAQPRGWQDHASTLRQFGQILAVSGQSSAWLDRYRPPRSLHYAGHLGISGDVVASAPLSERIDQYLADERIGFGYGALAAGADILIAERILANRGALHIILPTSFANFCAQSVAPYGAAWVDRFAACISVAESVREMTGVSGAYEPLANMLSGEVAMGAAALNARALESEAVQLLIIDEGPGKYGSGAGTARDGGLWAASERRQAVMSWPRNAPVAASGEAALPEGSPDRRLAAMLYTDFANFEALDEQQVPVFLEHVLQPLAAVVKTGAVAPFHVNSWGQGLNIAFSTVDAAAACAVEMQRLFNQIDFPALGLPATLALKVAGHYGLVHMAFDPVTGQNGLFGSSATLAGRIEPVTAAGAIYVTEDFVSALWARGRFAYSADYVGSHEPLKTRETYRLFALKDG